MARQCRILLSPLRQRCVMEWGYYVPIHLLELKLMSSPSLSDPPVKSDKAALDERGTQQRKAGANATWNSIHNAVIAVFQKKDLGENELCVLNDGVRQLLKTELGSFFTEYLQNQLLTKGMVILRDKIRFYEGQKLLDSLAETWSFFFCDVLSMLQAIFYPVQGKEPSVRQLALLHFRNIITLNIKLEDALSRPRARVPPAIIQMLLILQGVHESKGVTEDYLRLEGLVQKVVSPYLGSHGLYSNDGSSRDNSSCVLEKRLHRRWPKPGDHAKNPVVRSQSYNVPMLTPLVEYDVETSSVGSIGIRRHSVSEMTSCLEEGSVSDNTTTMPLLAPAAQPGLSSPGKDLSFTVVGSGSTNMSGSVESGCLGSHLQPSSPSTSIFQDSHSAGPFLLGGGKSMVSTLDLCRPHVGSAPKSNPSCSSSPETIMDQILDSIDSDHEGISDQDGIFLEFSHRRCSDSS